MEHKLNKLFTYSAIFPVIFISFISIFFIPTIVNYYSNQATDEIQFEFKFFKLSSHSNLSNNEYDLLWPTSGYKTITSKFGYGNAPARGASKYHGGIDIAAPERNQYMCFSRWNSNLCRMEWCKWIYCNN